MSQFLNLPNPPLPPPLLALQRSAARQEPGSGFSTNLRPLRARRTLASHQPNPFLVPDDNNNNSNDAQKCPTNETMLQGFEWYVPADGQHWQRLKGVIPALARLGVTRVWIPPACRAARPEGNGYDVYDLWDLGEFKQKGGEGSRGTGTGTKWGRKEELVGLARLGEREGVKLVFDAVLNHKAGADYCEVVRARRVDPLDRRRWLHVDLEGGEGEGDGEGEEEGEREIEAWTGFEFKGRAGKYSEMVWGKEHFTGVDYDHKTGEKGVFKLEGKEWAEDVDEELGNYDFLLFADIDHKHPEVRAELFRWVEWLAQQVPLGGLRLDAIKHYSYRFVRDFVTHVKKHVDPNWFIVGEYWREDSEFLAIFVEFMGHQVSLFDVQLVSNFSRVSLLQDKGDLRTMLDDCLALWKPDNTVTFVVNHDTQAGQSLELPVAPFFIPLAYALILLRANCGLPCVFYADLYGSIGQHPQPGFTNFTPPTSGGLVLPKLMLARKLWAYGSQYDYFDNPRCVGFTRTGHSSQSDGAGLAVVMTNGWGYASKAMLVGKQHAGEVWTDVLRWCPGQVVIGVDGSGVFPVGPRSVAVWVSKEARGRASVDELVFDTDIYGFERQGETELSGKSAGSSHVRDTRA